MTNEELTHVALETEMNEVRSSPKASNGTSVLNLFRMRSSA
jgi:hypothetical protein